MHRVLVLLLFVLAVVTGCAKKAPDYAYAEAPAPPPPPPADYGGMDAMDYAPSAATETVATSSRARVATGAARPSKAAASPATSAPAGGAPAQEAAPEPDDDQGTESAGPRMVHYNGFARLQATKTEELLEAVVKLAESMGGFVEQLTPDRVTVRVPVARFDEAFKATLALGEVLDKSITAEDVTDAFLAVDLRLETARGARDRLVALLASAKDENEKLRILAQIRRLSEEIDVMEGQLRTLAALASYSRITVAAVARPAFASQAPGQDPVGFAWIHHLSPFKRDVAYQGKLSRLDVPKGFVPLNVGKRFHAESADGAVIWTTKLDNEPLGDAGFWVSAIKERLGPEFAKTEVAAVGPYQVIRFESERNDPYRYLIGVRVDGDDLHLVEVYYPSPAHEERYKDAVTGVIAGGQS